MRRSGWIKLGAVESGRAEVLIFGEIGWEVTASTVSAALDGVEADELLVRVNSPGGDAYEGVAIMNLLRSFPGRVTVIVEGLAASAASVIAVGGADRLVMRPGSELMIHDAWAVTQGDSASLSKRAADLDRMSATIAAVYAEKAGGDAGMWRDAMSAETWFTADEAVQAGLADAVEDARDGKKALAGTFNLAGFKHAGRADAPAPQMSATIRAAEKKEDGMDFLGEVARKLGVTDSDADAPMVLAALDQVLAEQTADVTVTTTVTYPDGVDVVPTGMATVAPVGQVPEGLTFAVGDTPEGWGVEVNETSGEITVTAPDGGAVGDSGDITVTVSGGDADPASITVTATIVSAADDTSSDTQPPAEDPQAPTGLTAVVDLARLAELENLAAYGREAMARDHQAAATEFAAKAVADHKIGAAAADRWAQAWLADREDAEQRMASIRPGTVHRTETGHARAEAEGAGDEFTDREAAAAAVFHTMKG